MLREQALYREATSPAPPASAVGAAAHDLRWEDDCEDAVPRSAGAPDSRAILAAVTIPAHAPALRAPWPTAPRPQSQRASEVRPVARSRPFLFLAAAFTLNGFAMYAVVIALVPLLTERGASPTAAAWARGLGGAGQPLGRTLYATLARHTGVTTRTVTLIVAGGATTAARALTPGPYPLLLLLAIVAGMVRGNLTLLQATAVTDRLPQASERNALRTPVSDSRSRV